MNAIARTAEESRARLDVPRAILLRSGFGAAERLLASELSAAADFEAAQRVVTSHGRRLWVEATREQTTIPDDRPLYWARLGLAAALRRWRPEFAMSDEQRDALLDRLDQTSRGHDDLVFPPDEELIRVIVTGFDPFGLDEEIRTSNPSGTAALALHRTALAVGDRTAVIRTALFPVRWRDFTAGIMERVLLPHYRASVGVADAVITLSQGRSGRFDIEAHNGVWRGGGTDNNGQTATGPIPSVDGVEAGRPQWSPSSLPTAAIVAEAAGRFPVHDNTEVTEIPAGDETPVTRPDGPSEGSRARRGGGGDYLSNEIAYRNTVLRDATGRSIPAGHVHTPKLRIGTDDPTVITTPEFERDRADIVDQVRSIVVAALGAKAEPG